MAHYIRLTNGRTFSIARWDGTRRKELNDFCFKHFGYGALDIESLPYVGNPTYDYQTGDLLNPMKNMLFCMDIERCAGFSSCPRSPACSE